MKKLMMFLLVGVLLVVVVFSSGCAMIAADSSPSVYAAARDARVAELNSRMQYHLEEAKSYEAGTGGVVSEVEGSATLRTPGYYQNGILINRHGRPVTFNIRGDYSVMVDVGNTGQQIQLPPGRYEVSIYSDGNSWPYERGYFVIDSKRNDNTVNGEIYDFFITAP